MTIICFRYLSTSTTPQSTKCHTQFQISRPQDSGPVSMSAAQGQSEASPPPRLLVIPATFLASSAAALAATAIKMFVNSEVEFSGMKMCVLFIRQKSYCVDFQAIFLNVRGESKIIIKLNWIKHRKFATFKIPSKIPV